MSWKVQKSICGSEEESSIEEFRNSSRALHCIDMNKKISDCICILEDGGLQLDNEIWTVFECNMCKKVKNNMAQVYVCRSRCKRKVKTSTK